MAVLITQGSTSMGYTRSDALGHAPSAHMVMTPASKLMPTSKLYAPVAPYISGAGTVNTGIASPGRYRLIAPLSAHASSAPPTGTERCFVAGLVQDDERFQRYFVRSILHINAGEYIVVQHRIARCHRACVAALQRHKTHPALPRETRTRPPLVIGSGVSMLMTSAY